MADENKIVTPSDIEEAKTETVDTQTTATVENTVAEKDEKVESVVTDEEIAKKREIENRLNLAAILQG